MKHLSKYIIEFLGTFFLVLTIALSGNAFAIGAVLMTMIYMGGYISGAHYNPAVTLAVYIRGKIRLNDVVLYWIAQCLGGLVAALVYASVRGIFFVPAPGAGESAINIFILELLYTFALASVVLHVATSEKTKDNQYYGLAIGFTVMAGAFAAGPLSGGVFNPAVALGPTVVDYQNLTAHLPNLYLYLSAPLLGGLLAGVVYRMVQPASKS